MNKRRSWRNTSKRSLRRRVWIRSCLAALLLLFDPASIPDVADAESRTDSGKDKPKVELGVGWDRGNDASAGNVGRFEFSVSYAGASLANRFYFVPGVGALENLAQSDKLSLRVPWARSAVDLRGELSAYATIAQGGQYDLAAEVTAEHRFPGPGNVYWVSGFVSRAVPALRADLARSTFAVGAGDTFSGELPGDAGPYQLKVSYLKTIRRYSFYPDRDWSKETQQYRVGHPLLRGGRMTWVHERVFMDYPDRPSGVYRKTTYQAGIAAVSLGEAWRMRADASMTVKRYLFAAEKDRTTLSADGTVERRLNPEWTLTASCSPSISYHELEEALGDISLLDWRTYLATQLSYHSTVRIGGSPATTAQINLGAGLAKPAGAEGVPQTRFRLRLSSAHSWDEHWLGRLAWTLSSAGASSDEDGYHEDSVSADGEGGAQDDGTMGQEPQLSLQDDSAPNSRFDFYLGYRW